MKTSFSLNSSAVNKSAAISRHQLAIKNAKELMAVEGNDRSYYDWHRRTIKENENAIKAILDDPDTNWN
jgi:hypothetical protein